MSIGEELTKARVARGLTPSQVALTTRMKVQTVEALEHEEFDRIAAPIYAKGFIRLYAQCVGLDPGPLIEEYTRRFMSKSDAPSPLRQLKRAGPPPPADVDSTSLSGQPPGPDLFGSQPQAAQEAYASGDHRSSIQAQLPGSIWTQLSSGCRNVKTQIGSRVGEIITRLVTILRRRLDFRRLGAVSRDNIEPNRMRTVVPKIASFAAGILVLLVFLVSVLSRCVRWPAHSARSDSYLQEEVTIAVEVPQPYFE